MKIKKITAFFHGDQTDPSIARERAIFQFKEQKNG